MLNNYEAKLLNYYIYANFIYMENRECPSCSSTSNVKSGIVSNKQRYKCKSCGYYFTVNKLGKGFSWFYVKKALQLYLEGLTFREIERILGISHTTVMNWVKKYNIKRPKNNKYYTNHKLLNATELSNYILNSENSSECGYIITKVGKKFAVIEWKALSK